MKRLIFCTLMILTACGCATSPREAYKVDPGSFPENYAEMIQCYLNFKLGDASDLKDFAVIKPPEKIKADTFYTSIPLREGDEVWESFIVYDVKSRDGRYIGKDLHVVWIRDSKVVAFDYSDIELDFRLKQRMGNPCLPDE